MFKLRAYDAEGWRVLDELLTNADDALVRFEKIKKSAKRKGYHAVVLWGELGIMREYGRKDQVLPRWR